MTTDKLDNEELLSQILQRGVELYRSSAARGTPLQKAAIFNSLIEQALVQEKCTNGVLVEALCLLSKRETEAKDLHKALDTAKAHRDDMCKALGLESLTMGHCISAAKRLIQDNVQLKLEKARLELTVQDQPLTNEYFCAMLADSLDLNPVPNRIVPFLDAVGDLNKEVARLSVEKEG